MGNYRFKLSELIPNAWFYKLKDMGKSGKQRRHQNSTASLSPTNKHHTVPPPTTTTPRTPRRSSYRSRPTKTPPSGHRLRHRPTVDTKSSSNSADSTATGTGSFSPDCRSDQVLLPDESLNSYCHSPCSSKLSKAAAFTPPPELDLRPIITKPAATVRKTAGVKLRLRSPRISTRKSVSSGAGRGRAVVKASVDPRRDFKESMEEMIAENNIRDSKDLEELLACYLCLNSDEYHAVIINVFKQIWIDLYLPPH